MVSGANAMSRLLIGLVLLGFLFPVRASASSASLAFTSPVEGQLVQRNSTVHLRLHAEVAGSTIAFLTMGGVKGSLVNCGLSYMSPDQTIADADCDWLVPNGGHSYTITGQVQDANGVRTLTTVSVQIGRN